MFADLHIATDWMSVFVLGPFKFLDMEIKHLYVITHKFIGQHASDILNKWSMCQVCHMKIVERDQKKKSFSSELQSFELLCNIHGKIYVLLFNQQSNNFESKRREFKRKDTHLQKPYTFNDSKSFCITPIWQQKLPVRRKKNYYRWIMIQLNT